MFHRYATLGDVLYFHFTANDEAGVATDPDSTAFAVRKCGAAAGAAPVATGGGTLLSHASYPAGAIEVEVDTAGLEAGASYAVIAQADVGGSVSGGVIGEFTLAPVPATGRMALIMGG